MVTKPVAATTRTIAVRLRLLADDLFLRNISVGDTFEDGWWFGLRKLPMFRLTGMTLVAHRANRWRWIVSLLIAAGWGSLPLWLDVTLRRLSSGSLSAPAASTTGLYFLCSLNFVTLLFAVWAWAGLGDRAHWVDQMSNDTLRSELRDAMGRIYQLSWIGYAAAATVLICIQWGRQPLPTLASCVCQLEAVIIVGSSMWLAFSYPTILSTVYRHRKLGVTYTTATPASTAGLRVIASSISVGGAFLLIALVFAVSLWLAVR